MSTIKAINIKHPSSANTNIVMDANGNMTVAGTVVGGNPTSGFKNTIINGSFDIWQRGTTITAESALAYNADRFLTIGNQTGSTVTRQSFGYTDTLGGLPAPAYYYRFSPTVTSGAADRVVISQRVENWRMFLGRYVTLSFWYRKTAGISESLLFQIKRSSGFYDNTVEINGGSVPSATNWTYFTTTVFIPANAASGQTMGADASFAFVWYYQQCSSTGYIDIANVQMELGTVATPFENRPIATELALCQRYFEMSYPQGVAIGTATAQGSYAFGTPYSTVGYQVGYGATIPFKVIKRVTNPTVTFYSLSGTATKLSTSSSLGTELATNSAFPINPSDSAVSLINWSGGTVTVLNNVFGVHYIVTAEL